MPTLPTPDDVESIAADKALQMLAKRRRELVARLESSGGKPFTASVDQIPPGSPLLTELAEAGWNVQEKRNEDSRFTYYSISRRV